MRTFLTLFSPSQSRIRIKKRQQIAKWKNHAQLAAAAAAALDNSITRPAANAD